ncbi:hypothetical protein NBZ79_02465 [Sneathiella marina]|uniref:Uncharacterized protein n=1 Tax=Sneathiella marina TaxID=2950108 RepID=A0ABY4W3S5_9PROT|nr:hypothetical protein [Sneathiella marina]USG61836.1 hypothetical protein NBZ79_02465 [Sneathiella marina]
MDNFACQYQPHKSLAELKIRSKIMLKSANQNNPGTIELFSRNGVAAGPYKHKDGLKLVSQWAGFKNWQHASHVLSGSSQIGEDMGTLWYTRRCQVFLNIWCRDYDEAKKQHLLHPGKYIVPFKTQFIIVDDDYMKALGIKMDMSDFDTNEEGNLAGQYGTKNWDNYTFSRIQFALGNTVSF